MSLRRPREILGCAHAAGDVAPLRGITETEADSPRNLDDSEVHIDISCLLQLNTLKVRPPSRSINLTRTARRLVRSSYIVGRTSLERTVLESHRTAVGWTETTFHVRAQRQFLA